MIRGKSVVKENIYEMTVSPRDVLVNSDSLIPNTGEVRALNFVKSSSFQVLVEEMIKTEFSECLDLFIWEKSWSSFVYCI